MSNSDIQPAVKDSLERQVLQRLRQLIVQDGLQPGDKLPGERELAERLCVSRNTVRGSFAYLEAIGAVSRSPKRGAILQPVDFTALAEASQFLLVRSEKDLSELFVARQLLETNLMPLVVRNATKEHFARLEAAIRRMEDDIEAGGFGSEADRDFHQTLLDAAGNTFLTLFGTLIHAFFQDPRTHHSLSAEENRQSLADHRQIVAHLKAGNAEAAREAMQQHLSAYIRRGVIPPDGGSAA